MLPAQLMLITNRQPVGELGQAIWDNQGLFINQYKLNQLMKKLTNDIKARQSKLVTSILSNDETYKVYLLLWCSTIGYIEGRGEIDRVLVIDRWTEYCAMRGSVLAQRLAVDENECYYKYMARSGIFEGTTSPESIHDFFLKTSRV